jgi:putative SOS response-associated peptidase YedK
MCGRFTITVTMEEVEKLCEAEFEKQEDELMLFPPNYNASPGQKLPVITNEAPNKIVNYRWGLIPFWAKDPTIGYKLINARSESILEKPSFKNAFKKRRCLIPADGYYEWDKKGKEKKPYRITLKNGELFSFAGIWETWTDKSKNQIRTFSIITTEANELTKKLHDRMPCILNLEQKSDWLDIDLPEEVASEMLKQYPSSKMKMYEVSPKVNSPKNNTPDLVKPVK